MEYLTITEGMPIMNRNSPQIFEKCQVWMVLGAGEGYGETDTISYTFHCITAHFGSQFSWTQ